MRGETRLLTPGQKTRSGNCIQESERDCPKALSTLAHNDLDCRTELIVRTAPRVLGRLCGLVARRSFPNEVRETGGRSPLFTASLA